MGPTFFKCFLLNKRFNNLKIAIYNLALRPTILSQLNATGEYKWKMNLQIHLHIRKIETISQDTWENNVLPIMQSKECTNNYVLK